MMPTLHRFMGLVVVAVAAAAPWVALSGCNTDEDHAPYLVCNSVDGGPERSDGGPTVGNACSGPLLENPVPPGGGAGGGRNGGNVGGQTGVGGAAPGAGAAPSGVGGAGVAGAPQGAGGALGGVAGASAGAGGLDLGGVDPGAAGVGINPGLP